LNSINVKDTVELVGIVAIVALLVFVGLQLKQSQEIAIASQYHERAALAVEMYGLQMESGDLKNWGKIAGRNPATDRSIEDLGRFYLTGRIFLAMADNHYYQFQSGFLDDESWQGQRLAIKRALANPASPFRYVFLRNPDSLRESFVDFCNELIAEIKSEAGE